MRDNHNRPTHYVPRPAKPGTHRYVTFSVACKLFIWNAFQTSGRSSRSAYWWAFLGIHVSAAIFVMLFITAGAPAILSDIFTVLIVLPSLTISARRFQDIGWNGWWALLNVPGLFVTQLFGSQLGTAALMISIALVIFASIQPGISGPNAYGPDEEAGLL